MRRLPPLARFGATQICDIRVKRDGGVKGREELETRRGQEERRMNKSSSSSSSSSSHLHRSSLEFELVLRPPKVGFSPSNLTHRPPPSPPPPPSPHSRGSQPNRHERSHRDMVARSHSVTSGKKEEDRMSPLDGDEGLFPRHADEKGAEKEEGYHSKRLLEMRGEAEEEAEKWVHALWAMKVIWGTGDGTRDC